MEILKLRSTITEMKISLEIKQYATKYKNSKPCTTTVGHLKSKILP